MSLEDLVQRARNTIAKAALSITLAVTPAYSGCSDIAVPPAILNALRTREKVLYLHSEKELNLSSAEWEPYLHPATKLEGKSVYYCAYIENPNMYDLQLDNVTSYKTYLERL